MPKVVLAGALILAGIAALAPEATRAISTAGAEYDEALRLAPRFDQGAKLFELCAVCHGQDGHGTPDGSIPAIAGQAVPVLVNQLIEFRYDARHSMRVQGFMDHHPLTPQNLADVAAYVNSLPPRQPASGQWSPQAMRGEALFNGLCAFCHGPRGEGYPAARVPRLAGQHPEYLAEQLRDAAAGRRPSMEHDHARLLTRLSSDDIAAVSMYLAGISPSALATDP